MRDKIEDKRKNIVRLIQICVFDDEFLAYVNHSVWTEFVKTPQLIQRQSIGQADAVQGFSCLDLVVTFLSLFWGRFVDLFFPRLDNG